PTVIWRQRTDGAFDTLLQPLVRQGEERVALRRCAVLQIATLICHEQVEILGVSLRWPPQKVDGEIRNDAIEPCIEAGVPRETVQATKDSQKRLLHDFASVVFVAHQAGGYRKGTLLMGLHQQGKRPRIPETRALEQLLFLVSRRRARGQCPSLPPLPRGGLGRARECTVQSKL